MRKRKEYSGVKPRLFEHDARSLTKISRKVSAKKKRLCHIRIHETLLMYEVNLCCVYRIMSPMPEDIATSLFSNQTI
jgi:hypothetical protein